MSHELFKNAAVKPGNIASKGAPLISRFHSMADMCAVPAMTKESKATLMSLFAAAESSDSIGRPSVINWYGIQGGPDQVLNLIENGWPEGVKRMTDAFGKLTTSQTATSIKRIKTRGDHGDEFDIHRAYSGGLDKAWSRRAKGRRPASRCVTLVYNAATSWTTRSEAMFWRGAAVLCLTDLLSNAGYAVEVVSGFAASGIEKLGSETRICEAVTLKAATDPTNLNSLASGLCLAGFLRTIGHMRKASGDFQVNSHMGMPSLIRLSDIEAPEQSIVVEGSTINSQADAQAFIETTLAGIEDGSIAL